MSSLQTSGRDARAQSAPVLHLVVDDKFIDMAIREFEAATPGVHRYLTLDTPQPYRHIRDPRVEAVDLAGFTAAATHASVRAVVFHGLPTIWLRALAQVPARCTTVWLGWGYDYYGLIADAFAGGLLLPGTASLRRELELGAQRALPPSELSWARPYAKPTPAQQRLLARVDIFCPVLRAEHRMAQKLHPWLRARYMPWNYGTLEDDFTPELPADHVPGGPDLLVGNSATPTNNHLEAFQLIREQIDLSGRRVVVPLSYGEPGYRDLVLRAGRQLLGPAFHPLVDYMAKADYMATLRECGTVVMNQIRQQALGNVYIAMAQGARVFLHPDNPMLPWLQGLGCEVGDVHALQTTPLTDTAWQQNLAAIRAHVGRDAQRRKTSALVQCLLALRTA